MDELMFERLFTPLGIQRSDLVWRKNQYRPDLIEGIKRREFGAGISANVEAMARFGLLWLRGGEWNGARLLPSEFVRQAASTISGVPGLPVHKPEEYGQASDHYGLLWWNNADGAIPSVPRDTYWSWGLYDSLIVVMPTLDIVAARAGKSWKRTEGADHYDVLRPFLQPIVAAATRPAAASGAVRPIAPYPPSPMIAGIEWAPKAEILRKARGSDNWPITWDDDDALYTAYADGRGFDPFIVYLYSPDSDSAYAAADRMVLARVRKDLVRDRAAYELFVRLDGRGRPLWSPELAERGGVFAHPGRCYRSSVSYNPALRRYLWVQTLPASRHPQGPRFQGGFGIYDAPEPWGPWTTVFFTEDWDVGPGETASVPTKWLSADGWTLHLVFSGDDAFSVRRATLVPQPGPAPPAPPPEAQQLPFSGARLCVEHQPQGS